MRKIKIPLLLLVLSLLSSCQFNQTINSDITTGAYSRGNGIGCDDIIIEIEGKEENRNEFVYGEKVYIKFDNISGLKNVNGKTYPELSLHIVENVKDTIISYPNLLKDLNDGTDLNPLQLSAYFSAALPYKEQQQYVAFIKISDKKSENTFHYELPFTIKESDFLKVENNGINYSNIYLWNETLKKIVSNQKVDMKHQYYLIMEGIEGLSTENDMVYPVFSIDIRDSNRNSVLSSENILNYDEKGVSATSLKEQVYAKITFPQTQKKEDYTITAKLSDKNSSNKINVSATLIEQ